MKGINANIRHTDTRATNYYIDLILNNTYRLFVIRMDVSYCGGLANVLSVMLYRMSQSSWPIVLVNHIVVG